jgi:two-component system, chemotaxis family, protein-glutamate methylesterase/glutaminase
MSRSDFEIIVIGGSSGCIPVVTRILDATPVHFTIPIVIIIHRMKNVTSELKTILSLTKTVIEPEDKEPILEGRIYLAPQNYHLLVEHDRTFSLDSSETVNYSRPSIDVSFTSICEVYRSKTVGILLSGANDDGAAGIDRIIRNGGRGIVQDPADAEFPIMPASALKMNYRTEVFAPDDMINTFFK